MVDAAQLRDKRIILVMASAGLRRVAIQYLRIQDREKIDRYGLYKIKVPRLLAKTCITLGDSWNDLQITGQNRQ